MGSQFNIKGIEMNINYTFDLTTTTAPINHISLSAKLNLGDKGRKAKQSLIQSKYAEGIYLYSQGTRQSISTAIIHWQEAKELSESIGIKYDPAIEAIKIAQDKKYISTSILQRSLNIGYATAKRVIEDMCKCGYLKKDITAPYDRYTYTENIESNS